MSAPSAVETSVDVRQYLVERSILPETKSEILRRMTRGLMELYGMTEGIGTVLEPEDMERKLREPYGSSR
jgi:hypothetical protein